MKKKNATATFEDWGLFRIGRKVHLVGYDTRMKVPRITGPVRRFDQDTQHIVGDVRYYKVTGPPVPSKEVKEFAERQNKNGKWATHRLGDFKLDINDEIPF